MTMPETAVDEDDDAIPGQYNVWAARQILAMETKPIAKAMKSCSHNKLRLGVLPPDFAHQERALFLG